jgi:cob(I)alamin adenosyltransferase
MKKSPLYTGGGDKGLTALVGGRRVPKTHPRIEAYGTLDELNAFIGQLIAETNHDATRQTLHLVQHQLFDIGAYLANPDGNAPNPLDETAIRRLEESIDHIDVNLPPMKGFVLPGGCPSAALAHVCRTVCRRAERLLYTLHETVTLQPAVLVYINRLSDLLFAIARNECRLNHKEEILWQNTCS